MPLVRRPLDTEVENLVRACGFDDSESASEEFAYILLDAAETVIAQIEASHDEGLCWDATHSLASEIYRLLSLEQKGH